MFWKTEPKINTAEAAINEVLTRGVENVIPRELAVKKLRSGERLRIYLGIDPTGAHLHLGHTVALRKLRALSDLGHDVILVVGSFTAMIGDPSGRDALREPLTKQQVEDNFRDYKRQAQKILDLARTTVRYNHEWLEKLSFSKIVELAGKFTVQQLIQRDMFQKRISEGKPIALHEFLYPVMVGYDSVVLDVDGELGGSDQEFNILAGRQLQTAYGKRDKFVLTTKLIPGLDGRKMSKTYGNSVYLDDSPTEMFGKLMSLNDDMVSTYFDVCTDLPKTSIDAITAGHPKEAKMELAKEIVSMYHGKAAAETAASRFDSAFAKGGVPEDAPEVVVGDGGLVDALLVANVVASKSEYRRLVSDGAVRVAGTEEKLSEHSLPPYGKTLRIGKHRFVKIVKK